MAYFSENLTILVAKVETVPGTPATITSADFDFKVFNPTITMSVEANDEQAKYANGNHSEDVAVMGIQSGTIAFTLNLAKGANNYTAPKWAKFAYGAGLSPVSYTGIGWGLQPLKAYDEKPLTMWVYKLKRGPTPTATCFKFSGCMGTLNITGEGTGKPVILNFSYSGKLVDIDFDVANASIPEINNLDETCYERLLGTSIEIDGIERQCDTFDLDTGNEISPLKDMGQDTGIDFYGITKRNPRLTCDPLMIGATGTVPTDYAYIYGSATGCPSTPTISINTPHWTVTMPKCQLSTLTPGGRDGLSNFSQTWRLLGNGYTGVLTDTGLPGECTFEMLQGTKTY